MPQVSIIIPAFNASRYIAEAIASAQKQDIADWEAIIVDDGSTDGTATIVAAMATQDARLKLLQQENRGEAAARWLGVQHARSDLIYFLDADDHMRPDCLSRLVPAMLQHPDAVVVYGKYARIDASGKRIFPLGRNLTWLPNPSGDVFLPMLSTPLFHVSAALTRKAYLKQAMFMPPSNYAEDWFMWVMLAAQGNFYYVGSKPLVDYRIHRESQTHAWHMQEKHLDTIEFVFKHLTADKNIPPNTLKRVYRRRLAFTHFSLACKALRHGQYSEAASLFQKTLLSGKHMNPLVWVLYFIARYKWMPPLIKQHVN